jgi:hypothetical protein
MPEASPEQMMQPPMAMYGMSMPYAQYGGMPMADYGMTMGGFDFPYYPDEMAYGGVPRYDNGGGKKRQMTEAELEERRKKAKDIKKIIKPLVDSLDHRCLIDIE